MHCHLTALLSLQKTTLSCNRSIAYVTMATVMETVKNTFGFTAQELRDLQFVYKIFDVNGGGSIQGEEVRKALRFLAFKVTRVAVQQMLHDLQLSSVTKARSRNLADFEDFLEIVAKLQGLSFDQHEEIMQVGLRRLDH